MKLGVIYTVFNGLELLEGSIRQILDHVDQIVIVYQTVSNRGNSDPHVEPFVMRLMEKIGDRKIMAIPFTPNLKIGTKENERAKFNVGLEILKDLKCTHFMLSAVDHYYYPNEFKAAREKAEAGDWDVTLTQLYTYYKYPTWQITPIEDTFMPLICKLHPNSRYDVTRWSYLVDPAVRVLPSNTFYLYPQEEIMLHHYSVIREDVRNKFNNAAASSRWGDKAGVYLNEYLNYDLKENPGLHYFGGRKVIEVPNYFGI